MEQFTHNEGRFAGHGGLSLFYESWIPAEAPRGVVVIAHGLGEHCSAYPNVVGRLVPAGFAVYGFDLRGHGRSGGRRGFIRSWTDYRHDLRDFVRLVRGQQPAKPLFLLGHSLGGNIALDYALRYPEGLKGVVTIGPAIGEIGIPAVRMLIGRLLSRVWPQFTLPTGLDTTALSRDPEVVAAYRADPLVHGVGTARLATETERTTAWIQAHAADLSVPLLVMQGEADRIAMPDGSRRFVSKVAESDKELREYPGAFHQVHNDLCHTEATADLLAWLERHL